MACVSENQTELFMSFSFAHLEGKATKSNWLPRTPSPTLFHGFQNGSLDIWLDEKMYVPLAGKCMFVTTFRRSMSNSEFLMHTSLPREHASSLLGSSCLGERKWERLWLHTNKLGVDLQCAQAVASNLRRRYDYYKYL